MSDKEIEENSGQQPYPVSLIPANWEEIANLRLALLDQEYQECINATIKNPNPDHYEGLQKVILEQQKEEYKSEESEVSDDDEDEY